MLYSLSRRNTHKYHGFFLIGYKPFLKELNKSLPVVNSTVPKVSMEHSDDSGRNEPENNIIFHIHIAHQLSKRYRNKKLVSGPISKEEGKDNEEERGRKGKKNKGKG